MTPRRTDNTRDLTVPLLEPVPASKREALDEENFRRMITRERKRTERSKESFVLMLLRKSNDQGTAKNGNILEDVMTALLPTIRETDAIGWYQSEAIIGALFSGLAVSDKNIVLSTILGRVSTTLQAVLTLGQFDQVGISLHFFPDDWNNDSSARSINPALYPDLQCHDNRLRPLLILKRVTDVLGSALLLILSAPLFLIISLAIKASSKGPVFFRQQRVGRYGEHFTFLKFRSMYEINDHDIHKEYVTKLISKVAEFGSSNGQREGIYKLTNDKRVTRVGKFLRRTSLDELPQFLNVLIGDMSLVGPRPPIPYEVAVYQTWHRRRVLEAKPGITGLWQVKGRSCVDFDQMVRLDLRYASSWTPWLDLKIILRTPMVVIKGSGAY